MANFDEDIPDIIIAAIAKVVVIVAATAAGFLIAADIINELN